MHPFIYHQALSRVFVRAGMPGPLLGYFSFCLAILPSVALRYLNFKKNKINKKSSTK